MPGHSQARKASSIIGVGHEFSSVGLALPYAGGRTCPRPREDPGLVPSEASTTSFVATQTSVGSGAPELSEPQLPNLFGFTLNLYSIMSYCNIIILLRRSEAKPFGDSQATWQVFYHRGWA